MPMTPPPGPLTDDERALLSQGRHEALAARLAGAGRHALAGWVLEQIWDFQGACEQYARGDRPLDALRAAIELGRPDVLDRVIATFEVADGPTRDHAALLLQRRGRHADAARVLAFGDHDPHARARALARAGDRLGAARVLADAGEVREALAALGPLPDRHAPTLQLAAELAWALGDAEGSVRHAQAAIRARESRPHRPQELTEARPRPGAPVLAASNEIPDLEASDDPTEPDLPALARLLARGLSALGHDLAAQIVLQGEGEPPPAGPVPPRFHVRRALPASYAGAAYEGIDRVTLQEVEIHLLLAELHDTGRAADHGLDPAVQDAIEAFERRAQAAAELDHPAIRPIVHFDVRAGVLILPHQSGTTLRALIRPPGMHPTRARALVTFLLDGLQAAHLRGLVHGSLLPAQIVCDAAGRPTLGPFGADEIAGLVATRTGALEELLTITAPEVRAGARPTAASDVFSAAALFVALLTGNLDPSLDAVPPAERPLVADALDPDPARRPDVPTLLARLRRPVADVRELSESSGSFTQESSTMAEETALGAQGLVVEAAAAWTDDALDALVGCDPPAVQPVLDRHGRRFALAPWPDGCRRLADDAPFRAIVPLDQLDALPPEAAVAVHARLSAGSWVLTPAGEWMLALDDLLTR